MAKERMTSVPTGDQAIPSAEVSPTAAHQPAAGADARPQKSWVWFAAILAFVVAFGVPYLLRTSGKRSDEPERAVQSAVATAEPNDFEQRMMQAAGVPTASPPLIVPQGPIPSSPIPADELFRRVSPAVVQVHSHDRQGRHTSSGSGFLVSKKGLIVTNYHVIKNAHSVSVVLAGDKRLAVSGATSFDEEADVAILSVPYQFSASPLELAGDDLPVGAKVYAIGSPRGFSNSMSDGIVSGYREIDRKKMVQTTAPISPGSSGGPLVDAKGQVVGVTTLTRKDSQNLNFAVRASIVAEHLLRTERESKLTVFPLGQHIPVVRPGGQHNWDIGPPKFLYGPDTRVYEMRIYYAQPGKLDGLNARFKNHTLKLFEKHGMTNVGYFVPVGENKDEKLVYFLSYPSKEAADKSWKALFADEEVKTTFAETEKDGRLVKKVVSKYLTPTEYSPALKVDTKGNRAFELRTYTATKGNLPGLDARFKDHTLKLFEKHGMSNLIYWHLIASDKNADTMLIYLLAHKSSEAAKASYDAFRLDSDWLAARKASEEKAGGSLTEAKDGVLSEFLKPTDYSPWK